MILSLTYNIQGPNSQISKAWFQQRQWPNWKPAVELSQRRLKAALYD